MTHFNSRIFCKSHYTQRNGDSSLISNLHKAFELNFLVMFSCSLCDKRFTRKHYVGVHVKTVHGKKREFQCYKCGRAFGEAGMLRRHVQAVHENVRPFDCSQCSIAFKTQAYLDTHVKAVHEKSLLFPCDQCEKVFRWKGDVNRHKKSEHGQVKQIRCSKCQACYFEKGTSSSKAICRAEAEAVVEGEYPCSLCGIAFQQQHVSAKHQAEIHHRLFTCEDSNCTATFNDQVNLKLHVRLNHDDIRAKEFRCQHCDRQYDLRSSLNRHVRQAHAHMTVA